MGEISISTNERFELVDITYEVQKLLEDFDLDEGAVLIFTKHTTTALMINEKETGLLKDFKKIMKELVPEGREYEHNRIDNNADSHLRAILLSSSLVVPVSNRRLELGSWQRIFLVELDGPRTRKIIVKPLLSTGE
ncbi:MAG: YjbQ family protein [Thermoplasmata archaeon]|nr:MAG: YjbQ family protein [Thermoplasmata archaeon]